MNLTAEDLLPLVAKLTLVERARLAQLALQVAVEERSASDVEAWVTSPVTDEQFGDVVDALGRDAEGWEGVAH